MMTAMAQVRAAQADRDNLDDLERRRGALYLRLEDGYQRIERALAEQQDVTRWEEFWLQLLEEYERVSDTLREAGH